MSIAVSKWAWRQNLSSTTKLVLLALADVANDEGVCWPSINTLSEMAGTTPRNVRRVMQALIKRDLLSAEQRYRSDGSCSSNRYRLSIGGSDKLTLAPDRSDTTPGHTCQGPPDASVIPGTTIGTQKESLQPPATEPETMDRGGGAFPDLVYPKNLLPAECSEVEIMIGALHDPLNQQVLDEWAGIIAAGAIRSSPLGCLRALIKRAHEGTFTPERALRVAQTRKTRQRTEATQAQIELPAPGPIDENSALVRRVMAIAQRSCKK